MINCISNRLRNRSQEVHTQLGIGSAQGKILNYVLVESEAHSVYQKDLEREFGLRPSTVTEMLNALEQKKLIQRVSDECDGRYKKNRIYRKSEKHERPDSAGGRGDGAFVITGNHGTGKAGISAYCRKNASKSGGRKDE